MGPARVPAVRPGRRHWLLPRPKTLRSTGVCFALGVSAVIACGDDGPDVDDNQFRKDVIWCEEAVSRLVECCPGFDPLRVECKYFYSYDEGCGAPTLQRIEPVYTEDESKCIRNTPCDVLVSTDVCRRAQEARAPNTTSKAGTSGGVTSTGTERGPAVCP